MPSACVMPTPPTLNSESSPRPRLRPSRIQHYHSSLLDPYKLHRIPTGRIGRARSASALSLSDINRQVIYEAAIEKQTSTLHPLFATCTSDDGRPLPDISEVDFNGDRTRACSVPTSSIFDQFSSSASDIEPITGSFTDSLPQMPVFSDCSSMEVMMPSDYNNASSYSNQYESVYGDSHSTSGEQSLNIAAQAGTPALSYAASYASTPPTIAASPALSHTSMSTPAQSLTRTHYQFPGQASYSPQYSRYSYDAAASSGTQGSHTGYASPYSGSAHYNQSSVYYHHQQHQHHQHQQQHSQTNYTTSQSSMYPNYYGPGSSHPDYATSHGESAGMGLITASSSDSPDKRPQCFEHGCNGRVFSTFSNLLRHQREKSGTAAKSTCPECGAKFTRTTARNGHVVQGKCKRKSSASVSEAESF